MEQNLSKRPIFPIYDMIERWADFAYCTPEVKPQHHALYHALIHQCKVRGGMSRFPFAYQHGMQACAIGSKATYLSTLKELQNWQFITYEAGANGYKSPIVEVHFRESTGNLLALYRYSYEESTDTSGGHNKEVERLEVERLKEELESTREKLDAATAALSLSESTLASKPVGETAKAKRATQQAKAKQANIPPVGERFATEADELTPDERAIWDKFSEWEAKPENRLRRVYCMADDVVTPKLFCYLAAKYGGLRPVVYTMRDMENKASLLKDYISAFKTLSKWLEIRQSSEERQDEKSAASAPRIAYTSAPRYAHAS